MKTLKNKLALGLLALNLVFASHAAAEEIELGAEDYILVSIPAESAEGARLIYEQDGSQVEAFPKHGDIVEINTQLGDENPALGGFDFLGYVDGNGHNTLEITNTNPIGYETFIKLSSADQKVEINTATPIVLEATGAIFEVVQGGGLDEIQAPAEKVFFTTESQEFDQLGVLDIRFVVLGPVVDDGGDDQGQGGENDENQPEAEASGGCSMVANASGSAFNLLGLLPLAAYALIRRRK